MYIYINDTLDFRTCNLISTPLMRAYRWKCEAVEEKCVFHQSILTFGFLVWNFKRDEKPNSNISRKKTKLKYELHEGSSNDLCVLRFPIAIMLYSSKIYQRQKVR